MNAAELRRSAYLLPESKMRADLLRQADIADGQEAVSALVVSYLDAMPKLMKATRTLRNIGHREAAAQADIGGTTWISIENGSRRPSFEIGVLIIKWLGDLQ